MPRVPKPESIPRRYLAAMSSQTFEKNYIYPDGMNTYEPNEAMPPGQLRLLQDVRETQSAKWKTRQACDFYSVPAGETIDINFTSVTGAANQTFSQTTWLAAKFTAGATGRLTKISVNVKNSTSGVGTPIFKIFSDNAGSPGTEMAQSSVAGSALTSSNAYNDVYFIEAPSIVSGTSYWVIAYIQPTATNSYTWSSTTSATTSKVSTDSGVTWSATSYALNLKTYISTSNATLGLKRVYKSDGTKKTLKAYKEAGGTSAVAVVDDVTGALTTIKTGLSANATAFRFWTANDTVWYVNGYDTPRKWDFTTESAVSGVTFTASNGCNYKGLNFFVDATDPTKLYYSNFAAYETFTSTDFIYVPSPKSGDPITAIHPLSNSFLIFTRGKKYLLLGTDNATFNLIPVSGSSGTFSQETVAGDENGVYYLTDDGVRFFDGTNDTLISRDRYYDIANLVNKDSACLGTDSKRVYLYFTPTGGVANNTCYVYNIKLGKWESEDTNAYVSRFATWDKENKKIMVGSSLVGQAMYQELTTNDYTNMGKNLNFEIRTHYDPYGEPHKDKEIRYWTPRFSAQSANYNVLCQYATNLKSPASQVSATSVQSAGTTWGSGVQWGSGFTWGSTQYVEPSLSIPGMYRYIQLRYKLSATRQPVEFFGHYIEGQIKRRK